MGHLRTGFDTGARRRVLKLLNTAQKDLLNLATGTTDDGKEVWVRIAEYLQTAAETAAENAD
jgi:plasmid stabilization system protein ParE